MFLVVSEKGFHFSVYLTYESAKLETSLTLGSAKLFLCYHEIPVAASFLSQYIHTYTHEQRKNQKPLKKTYFGVLLKFPGSNDLVEKMFVPRKAPTNLN
jgi:hypothetical protein